MYPALLALAALSALFAFFFVCILISSVVNLPFSYFPIALFALFPITPPAEPPHGDPPRPPSGALADLEAPIADTRCKKTVPL